MISEGPFQSLPICDSVIWTEQDAVKKACDHNGLHEMPCRGWQELQRGKRNGLERGDKLRKSWASRRGINSVKDGQRCNETCHGRVLGSKWEAKKELCIAGYLISAGVDRREFEWTEQMDGTPWSPNCVRLLYLEGTNRKQTKEWCFFFFLQGGRCCFGEELSWVWITYLSSTAS